MPFWRFLKKIIRKT